MIAPSFVASARHEELEWRVYCGDEERSDRRKAQARAAPAEKCGLTFCALPRRPENPSISVRSGHFSRPHEIFGLGESL